MPAEVISEWKATQKDEILASILSVYSRLESDWKRARFAPTSEGIRSELQFDPRYAEDFLKVDERLRDSRIKERVLWLLQFARFRQWNSSPIRTIFHRAVLMAAEDNDSAFFTRLGRRLEESAVLFKVPAPLSELSQILLDSWVQHKGICLCWFSDPALGNLLSLTGKHYSQDAIRKARTRGLQLVKLRRPLIKSVRKESSQIICE